MTKDRMIEILAEEMSKDTQIKIGQPFKLCSYDDALTAMSQVAQEVELNKKDYVQGYIDERDQLFRSWKHLDKMYQQKCDELTTLRAELERMTLQRDSLRSEVQNYHVGQTALLKEVESLRTELERLKDDTSTKLDESIEMIMRLRVRSVKERIDEKELYDLQILLHQLQDSIHTARQWVGEFNRPTNDN